MRQASFMYIKGGGGEREDVPLIPNTICTCFSICIQIQKYLSVGCSYITNQEKTS